MSHRVIQISDLHISANDPTTVDDLQPALAAIRADPPELVILTGDIVALDPDAVADHTLAAELVADIGVPLVALPGNHDIGECGTVPWDGPPVTEERLQRFLATWGADRFSVDFGPWRIIGLNCLVDETTLADVAAQQHDWVSAQLSGHDGPVGIFTHKPFILHGFDSPDPAGMVADLSHLLASASERVKFVASGHLHRGVAVGPDEKSSWTRIWSPSTHYRGREDFNCGARLDRGFTVFVLEDDGSFTFEFVWADS